MAALSSEEHALKMMVKLLKTLTKSLGEVKDEISLIASFYNRYPKAVEDEIWDWASRPCYELDRERNGVPCRDLKKAASEWALLSVELQLVAAERPDKRQPEAAPRDGGQNAAEEQSDEREHRRRTARGGGSRGDGAAGEGEGGHHGQKRAEDFGKRR